MNDLRASNRMPDKIIHAWCVGGESVADDAFDSDQERGFYSLMHVAQSLIRKNVTAPVQIAVLSTGLHSVTGTEVVSPAKATLLGACKATATR